jgi:hypothetical protein
MSNLNVESLALVFRSPVESHHDITDIMNSIPSSLKKLSLFLDRSRFFPLTTILHARFKLESLELYHLNILEEQLLEFLEIAGSLPMLELHNIGLPFRPNGRVRWSQSDVSLKLKHLSVYGPRDLSFMEFLRIFSNVKVLEVSTRDENHIVELMSLNLPRLKHLSLEKRGEPMLNFGFDLNALLDNFPTLTSCFFCDGNEEIE